MTGSRGVAASARQHAPSILVAALSAAFGVSLLQITGALAAVIAADDLTGSSSMVALVLAVLGFVFIAIAVYVGAVVTSNTFATIVAGRTRTIALLRLVGASARSRRRAIAREGLAVGVVGSVLGALLGTAVSAALLAVAVAGGHAPALPYDLAPPVIALPIVAVILTTWLASWVGSRRVLDVSPLQALGGSTELRHEELRGRRGRNAAALVLLVLGALLLAAGIVIGSLNPIGILPAVLGGMLSFSGLVLGAGRVMPPALRAVGRILGSRLLGGGAAARLAALNAVRYPERSTRTTIGLVIGVGLVSMFAVAAATYRQVLGSAFDDPEMAAQLDAVITTTVAIFSALLGFSALIAAVGLVNSLSLSVLQRTRELGLLRALGFTAAQLRRMISVESAQLTAAAVLVGLVVGIFYGWAGAQSLLSSMPGAPAFIVPVVPWQLVLGTAVAAALLTLAATVVPSRRATRVSPVRALASE
ncbi:ABC transporter permease [Herbiconiux sp.]|uniref:ABC transporter permease n=1 Tax=Herbiconiux sp. TaxID=1871186 RepID=UPI0025C72780|nr:ABC transporter permease [Herbiconiux sp.]